jgi:hypothetical protein
MPIPHKDELPKPEPCLRCASDSPLTTAPRDELFFYTALVGVDSACGDSFKVDTNRKPRGRLCEGCTNSFVEWLKEPRKEATT